MMAARGFCRLQARGTKYWIGWNELAVETAPTIAKSAFAD